MEKKIFKTETALIGWAAELLAILTKRRPDGGATVLALSGDLGAGKTTLMKALAAVLGVTSTVTSPTFVIMKSYQCADTAPFKNLYHLDVYRLEEESEIRPLRFSDLLSEDNALICVEWAEKILTQLPADAVRLTISHEGEGRAVTLS